MNPFDDLLKELSSLVGLSLHSDAKGGCRLRVGESLEVQMELNQERALLMYSFIEEINPGKFRETILKNCLIANQELLPAGILGYCMKNYQLSLHRKLPFEHIKSEELLHALSLFIDYAIAWQTALREGKTAPPFLESAESKPPPFGLKL